MKTGLIDWQLTRYINVSENLCFLVLFINAGAAINVETPTKK